MIRRWEETAFSNIFDLIGGHRHAKLGDKFNKRLINLNSTIKNNIMKR